MNHHTEYDQWGRYKLQPCPFCGAEGHQPEDKVFVRFYHDPECWLLNMTRYNGHETRVYEEEFGWNRRYTNPVVSQEDANVRHKEAT
jgi:hypothetical protein